MVKWSARHATAPRVLVLFIVVAALAGWGSWASIRNMKVTGHEVVVIDPDNNTEIWGVFPDIGARTPVTVLNNAGHVIGSGVLRFEPHVSARDGAEYNSDSENVSDFVAVYSFTVSVPRGLARYGIKIGSRHGTAWLSAAQMSGGPLLILGSMSWMIPNDVRCPVTPKTTEAAGMCAEHAGGGQFVAG
jgi:hypothetical protein